MALIDQIDTINKVLLIKLRYIGDAVLVTPLLESMNSGLPNASLDVLVSQVAADILMDHPHITKVFGFDKREGISSAIKLMRQLRGQNYDIVVDLTNNDRSMLFTKISGARIRVGFRSRHTFAQRLVYSRVIDSDFGRIHTVDHHLKVAEELGLPINIRHPFLVVNDESLMRIRHIFCQHNIDMAKGYVAIHHGARRWYKSWPHDKFAILADHIMERYGVAVVFIGGKDDISSAQQIIQKMQNRGVSLAGQIPLRDLPALLKGAICLVGNDSAPIHVATAVNTPVIALFGPTDARAWAPRRKHDTAISVNFPCKPCGHKNVNCPLGQNYCMSTIKVEQVWEAVERVFKTPA